MIFRILVISFLVYFSLNASVYAQVNDMCTDATLVTIGSTTSGDTTGDTFDGAPFCGTSNTAPGEWFAVVGNGNRLQASLCNGNTNYDSKISVFCNGCDTLTCITGIDDFCGLQSQVEFDTLSGATYFILIHGFGSATGSFELEVNDVGANDGTPISCEDIEIIPPSVSPAPTLSQWGLISFAAISGLIAIWFIRKRKVLN